MSRVGKAKIIIPSGVRVAINDANVEVSGKLGVLSFHVPPAIEVRQSEGMLSVHPTNTSQEARKLWGTIRRTLANLVKGVDQGFSVVLELVGVGYRAQVQGKTLVLQLGYSHDIIYPIPDGVTIACEKQTLLTLSSTDKQLVGQVGAEIRHYRKPEPYKGKGIHRRFSANKPKGDFVIRKEGKKR